MNSALLSNKQRRIGDTVCQTEWVGRLATSSHVLVVIPARNEAARMSSCLEALQASLQQSGRSALVVIVANNCTDQTVEAARLGCANYGLSAVILDTLLPDTQGVGTARSCGLSLGMELAPSATYLLSTDADCEVAHDWIETSIRTLDQFDMLCGRVEPLPQEAGLLPQSIYEPGALEHHYLQLLLQTESLIDTDPCNPWPHHGRASGANQGFRRRAYLASGGYASLLSNEDQEICQRLRRQGSMVRFSDEAVVYASCRLEGRAPQGMADALASRIKDSDSWADSLLEPAQTHLLRVHLRVLARQRLAAGHSLSGLAGALNINPRTLSRLNGNFDHQWSWIERHSSSLHRQRLRPSQLPAQIALLETALQQMNDSPRHEPLLGNTPTLAGNTHFTENFTRAGASGYSLSIIQP